MTLPSGMVGRVSDPRPIPGGGQMLLMYPAADRANYASLPNSFWIRYSPSDNCLIPWQNGSRMSSGSSQLPDALQVPRGSSCTVTTYDQSTAAAQSGMAGTLTTIQQANLAVRSVSAATISRGSDNCTTSRQDFAQLPTTFARDAQTKFDFPTSYNFTGPVKVYRDINDPARLSHISIGKESGAGQVWNFHAPDNARVNAAISIENRNSSGPVSAERGTHIVLIPRNQMPQYTSEGNFLLMTLATGEVARFDKTTQEFVSGPFRKVGNSYEYTGTGISIEMKNVAMMSSRDPRVSDATVTIRKGNRTCTKPAERFWSRKPDGGTTFNFENDAAALLRLRQACGLHFGRLSGNGR